MSQNNTNRDIRRFETDVDGNTTRVLLNTDEPLGLLDGDYQEQLEELETRLNAITGGAYSNTVQIGHGGTGAESAGEAMSNLVATLDVISSLNQNTLSFVAQQTGGSPSTIGKVYRVRQDAVAEQIGALKASNNLSDLSNTLTGLQNLYHDVPIAESQGGIPLKAWFDGIYVMLGRIVGTGGDNYYIVPNRYTLKDLVDNYLSEYLLKASNNLSDLSDLSESLGNLLNVLETFVPIPGPSVISQLSNYILCVGQISGSQQFPVTVPKKLTLDFLYNNYILPATNTEYGMTKDAQTNLYEFTGNAATATTAGNAQSITTANPTSSLGQRFFDVQRKTFRGLSGTATVTFDTLTTNSNTLNYNILSVSVIDVSTGKTVIVKGFSVSCESNPSDSNYQYTVSAEIDAQGSAIYVTLEVLYSYQYQ